MNLTDKIKKTFFSYHAISDNGKRQPPKTTIKTEDLELTAQKRKKLNATIQDAQRNMAILGWMIRKHLDYVTSFTLQVKTGDKNQDKIIEKKLNEWSKKENCDIQRRLSLQNMLRIFEATQVVDGDGLLVKISDQEQPKLQGVEGNRIGKPSSKKELNKNIYDSINDHGLVVNEYGAVDQYCINTWDYSSRVFDRLLDWQECIFDGYFHRFDQQRGVSPIAAAFNTLQDLYEGFDYSLVKAKMHAMMGVVISSDNTTSSGFGEYDGEDGDTPDDDTEKYKFDASGTFKLELDQGDKAELLESKTPSTEFKEFSELMMAVGMLSLDLAYCFFDASKTNYSSMKAARGDYYKSAESKIKKNQNVLNNITDWVLPWMYDNGVITVNPANIEYEWIPAGVPWIDETKEVTAAALRIATGLSSRQIECKKRGLDFVDVIEQLADEEAMAIKKSATISIGQPGQTTTREEEQQGENDE